MTKSTDAKLSPNIRVMIAIVASPTLMVIGYTLFVVLTGTWQEISVTGAVFSSLGIFAYYIVIVGQLPEFMRRFKPNTGDPT